MALFLAVVLSTTSGGGARLCCEGDKWLKWNNETRGVYILGLVQGYENGRHEGCEAALSEDRDQFIKMKTCARSPGPDNYKVEHIADLITQFYTQYPNQRFFYIQEVLRAITRSTKPDPSPEDIQSFLNGKDRNSVKGRIP